MCLIDLEGGYELHMPKLVSREESKAWALSVLPHFSLCPPPFLRGVIFMCTHVSLALLSLRKNGGLRVVYLSNVC